MAICYRRFLLTKIDAISVSKSHIFFATTLFCLFLMGWSSAFAEVFLRNRDYQLSAGSRVDLIDTPHVLVSGPIRPADVGPFENALTELRKIGFILTPDGLRQPLVVFDSPGGDVRAAMDMGRIARRELAFTFVKGGFRCDSACGLVFVAGVRRQITNDARLGIHRPFFEDYSAFSEMNGPDAMSAYENMSRLVLDFIEEMRVSAEFGKRLLETPSNRIDYIYYNEAEFLGLLNDDPAFEEWSIASQKKQLGIRAYRAFDAYVNCSSACKNNECRSICAERTGFDEVYDSKRQKWK